MIPSVKNYNSNFNSQIGLDYHLSTINDMANEIKKISTNNEEYFKSSIKSEFQSEEKIIGVKTIVGTSEYNMKKLNDYRSNLEEKIKGIKTQIIEAENIKLNYQRFSKLDLKVFNNLLYFFDAIDLFQLMKINKEIKQKFLDVFKNYSLKICQQFDNTYMRQLKSEQRILTLDKYKRNKRGHLKISLIIKAKIISDKFKDKTVCIGYKAKFPSDKEKLKNIFKFDVRAPGPLSFWIMREYTYVNYLLIKLVSSRRP